MRFSLLVTCFASTCFALTACADATSETGWTVDVSTRADGATLVTNTPPADAAPTWQLEEELRIGTVDGSGPDAFGQIRGLAALADGGVAVLDAQSQEVRIFDAAGMHRATFGGRGGGPGEFQGAFGLMLSGDDLLWVPDHTAARVSVLDHDDGYVTSYPLTFFSYGFVWNGALTDDHRILMPSVTLAAPRQNVLRVFGEPAAGSDAAGVATTGLSPAAGTAASGAGAAGLPRELALLDSLPLPTPPPSVDPTNPPGSFYFEAPGGMPRGYMSVPHYPQARQVVDARLAIWSTDAGDPAYRIRRWTPGGDTTLIIETARPAVPVTQEERAAEIERITESLEEYGPQRLDWSKIPQTKPAITSMFLARNGDLWVQAATADTLRTFDVYAQDGSYTGTAVTALDIYQYVSPVVREDRVWAIVSDEFDVQHVVRARIVPISPDP